MVSPFFFLFGYIPFCSGLFSSKQTCRMCLSHFRPFSAQLSSFKARARISFPPLAVSAALSHQKRNCSVNKKSLGRPLRSEACKGRNDPSEGVVWEITQSQSAEEKYSVVYVSVLVCMVEDPSTGGKARGRELFSQPEMRSEDITNAPMQFHCHV